MRAQARNIRIVCQKHYEDRFKTQKKTQQTISRCTVHLPKVPVSKVWYGILEFNVPLDTV